MEEVKKSLTPGERLRRQRRNKKRGNRKKKTTAQQLEEFKESFADNLRKKYIKEAEDCLIEDLGIDIDEDVNDVDEADVEEIDEEEIGDVNLSKAKLREIDERVKHDTAIAVEYHRKHLIDQKRFNKAIEKTRQEIIEEYPATEEVLSKISEEFISKQMEEKEAFLFGYSNKQMEELQNNKQLQNELSERMQHYKAPIVKNIPSNVPDENKVLMDTRSNDELLQDYRRMLHDRCNKTSFILGLRENFINQKVKERGEHIKKTIEIDRILADEKEHMEKTYPELKKYKDNTEKLQRDIKSIIKRRREKLEEWYIKYGIDPDKEDRKAMSHAKQIWKDVTEQQSRGAWKDTRTKDMYDYFKQKYNNFFNQFPIVFNYMLTHGQFHPKAFSRFLDIRRKNIPETDPKKRKKGAGEYAEHQNQASYAQYLAEEVNRDKGTPISAKQSRWVYKETFDKLRKETKEFKEKFEETNEELKKEKEQNNMELVEEFTKQLQSTPDMDISDDAANRILEILQSAYKADIKHEETVKQIETDTIKNLKLPPTN